MRDATTFTVAVDGVGSFTCRRRTMRTAIAITAEFNRLTEGAEWVNDDFAGVCNFISYLKGMVLYGPEDWDPYLTDPDSPQDMEKLRKVYNAIKESEGRFRQAAGTNAQGAGKGTGKDD